MNKKYSTLLTMGLLLAGSLGGVSAQTLTFAQKYKGDAATKVANGSKYILVQKNAAGVEKAFGFTDYDLDDQDITLGAIGLTENANDATYKQFVWTVSESGALDKTVVTFTNAATGKVLMVKKADAAALLMNYSDTEGYSSEWAWTTDFKSYEKAIKDGGKAHLLPALLTLNSDNRSVYDWISVDPFAFVTSSDENAVKLYSVKDIEVNDTDLNKLYNSNGFNFTLTTEGVENIFGGQKLKAIKVVEDISAPAVGGDYDAGFPAGVYLAVSTPSYGYDGTLDYLLNCEFIAVDPTDNATSSADLRKAGQGFKFTTVSGKNLNLFIDKRTSRQTTYAAKMTSGAEISVKNACFTITKNFDGDKYALSLDAMRYQKATGAATHDEAAVKVNIMSDLNYVSGKTLATVTGDNAFIFKFAESTIESPAKLLSKEGAAIYNIQFIGGYANGAYLTDRTETHRYLNTNGNGEPILDEEDNFTYRDVVETTYYTKGKVLADLEDPANQYIITNVSGSNITFMNRLTKNTFVAKLYKENDGCYSLNITDRPWTKVIDLSKENNMYKSYDVQMNGAHVKLVPATSTDAYNTYWTADDETLVTLAFARDLTPTSNKIYPAVKYDTDGDIDGLTDKMTDNVVKAAQWQLKVDWADPVTYQTQTYAYLDANSKVVYKTKGDTIAAVNYYLELIEDGNPSGWYLSSSDGTYTISQDSRVRVMIKDNFDGSVSITEKIGNPTHLAVSTYWDGKLNKLDRTMLYYDTYMIYTSYANDIKTYLIQDAPEVSLPIETTFVTMQSEMGNYISMNEDRDGILVNVEPTTFKVFATDSAKAVPSFYISLGRNEDGSRAFMFNPADSVKYYVGAGAYDKQYEWAEGATKVIFKEAVLNETADTLTTSIKGKVANVAAYADRYGTQAGLDKFKFQIVKADPEEDAYIIRQAGGYVAAINGKLTLDSDRDGAVLLDIVNVAAPTANEAIAAEAGVQVIGGQGVVTVQGAAGKVVTVANILGQTIANQVATSDNVTIAAPAGVVVVAVDGEATKVVVK